MLALLGVHILIALFSTYCAHQLPLIIGGDEVTEEGKWPWQGSLRIVGDHACGCSLIGPEWLVTAAHCSMMPSERYEVVLGSNYQSDYEVKIQISKIFVHPHYGVGEGQYPNDIALMKLAAKAEGKNIQPVRLADEGQFDGHPDCWITGWGFTQTGDDGGTVPEVLQEAHIEVYTASHCEQAWGAANINDGHICVGVWGQKASCQGDSGGPLVCSHRSGYFELVGVTSWGANGCYPLLPSVYTRVTVFRNWIKEVTGI